MKSKRVDEFEEENKALGFKRVTTRQLLARINKSKKVLSFPKRYILVVVGDTEAEVRGPFKTTTARDKEMQRIRREDDPDKENYIGFLDIDKNGVPTVGEYSGGFMEGLTVVEDDGSDPLEGNQG